METITREQPGPQRIKMATPQTAITTNQGIESFLPDGSRLNKNSGQIKISNQLITYLHIEVIATCLM